MLRSGRPVDPYISGRWFSTLKVLVLLVAGACGVEDETAEGYPWLLNGLDAGADASTETVDPGGYSEVSGTASLALMPSVQPAVVRGSGDFSIEITTCPAEVSANSGSADPVTVTLQTPGDSTATRNAWSFTYYQPNTSRQPSQTDRVRFSWPASLREPNELEAIRLAKVGSNDWCISSFILRWREAVLFRWTSEREQPPYNYVLPHPITGPVWLNDQGHPSFIRFSNRIIDADWYGEDYREHSQVFIETRTCDAPGAQTSDPIWVRIYHDQMWDAIRVEPASIGGRGQRRNLLDLSRLAHVGLIERIVLSAAEDGNAGDADDPWCLDQVRIKTSNRVLWQSTIANRLVDTATSAQYSPNRDLFFCEGICIDALDECQWRCLPKRQGYQLDLNSINTDCASGEPPSSTNDRNCNGNDDNCSGVADEQYPSSPTNCGLGACLRTGRTYCRDGAVLDSCTPGPRTGDDADCDAVDDDCDGSRDEHWSSASATNCIGECRARAVCQSGAVACGAPGVEVPGNGRDDDCNGADACSRDWQCTARLSCIDGECRAPHCGNGHRDADEDGTDCGGPACPPCDGRDCPACRAGERTASRAQDALRFSVGTFTRAGTATFEPEPGRIETARPNDLRWISVDGHRLALFEGTSTNMIRWSAALDHAPEWTPAPTAPMALTPNGASGPDESQTADLLRSPTGPSRGPSQLVSLMAGSWSFSFHARSTTEDFGDARWTRVFATGPSNTPLASKTLRIFDDWERVDVPLLPVATTAVSFGLSHVAGWPTSSTGALRAPDLAVWGAQLEPRPFPTTYIPTTSTTASRAADLLTIPGVNVPRWLGAAMWQVDVSPEFSSAELIPRPWQHTLLSYNASNDIALVASPNAGKARLSVKCGGVTFESPDLLFERGALLRLTFDMRAPDRGHPDTRGITISGADSGDGTYLVRNLAHPLLTTVRIGGKINGTSEAFAAIGEPRAIANIDEDCVADPSCTCGNGQVESGETCDPATSTCNDTCDAPVHEVCEDDSDCPSGQECADIADRIGRDPHFFYCWPIDPCRSNPSSACGSVEAPCGECQCQPDCSEAACGASNGDGCGNACADVCRDWEPGCRVDSECSAGFSCGLNVGRWFDLPADSNVCWPDLCDNPRERLKHCGDDAGALCGKCPDMPNDCGDRQCGTDRYGHSCGQCMPSQICEDSGKCRGRPLESIPDAIRPHLDNPPANDVGTLPGAFAVDESGAATYSVPIEVPPGRAGLAPNLALTYRSSSGHGYVARGWSLTGLSGITRCARTFAQDGFARGIQNSAADAFCLDGKRLVAVRGAYGADGTEYRTELDSFVQVVSHGDPAPDGKYMGPTFFEVRTKEGRILTFGREDMARVTARIDAFHQDPSRPRNVSRVNVSWMLQVIADHSGNQVRIEYERDFVSDGYWAFPQAPAHELNHVAEIRPVAIYYGDNDSHTVRFEYRDDMVNRTNRGYRGGVARQVSNPLKNIITSIHDASGNVQVRRYALASHFSGGAWLLDTITPCAAHETGERCMPPTSFLYRESEPGVIALDTTDEVGDIPVKPNYPRGEGLDLNIRSDYEPSNYSDFDIFAFDHDGDGAQDIVHSKFENRGSQDDEKRLYLRRSRGVFSGTSAFHAVGERISHSRCNRVLGVLDFDDNGRDDLIVSCYTSRAQAESRREVKLLRSTDAGFAEQRLQDLVDEGQMPLDERVDRLMVADLDGDGRKDLAAYWREDEGTLVKTWRNTGSGFAFVADHRFPVDDGECIALDWDGDQVAEVACQYDEVPTGHRRFSRQRVLALEQGELVIRKDGSLDIDLVRSLKLDANGDGITDLVVENWDREPELYLGTGRGYEYVTRGSSVFGASFYAGYREPNSRVNIALFVFDIDGDGAQELLEGDPITKKWIVHRPYRFDSSNGEVAWHSVQDASLPFDVPEPRDSVHQNSFASPITIDWDGDGQPEVLQRIPEPSDHDQYKHPRFQIWTAKPATKDLMSRITDGLGKVITINYAAKPSDYAPSPTGCSYPQRCLKAPPTPVVVDHTVSGSGGPYRDPKQPEERSIERHFVYSYADGRVDLRGRGWLGFGARTVKEFASATELVRKTSFEYDLRTEHEGLMLYYKAGRPYMTMIEASAEAPAVNGPSTTNHTRLVLDTLELLWSDEDRPFVVSTFREAFSMVSAGGDSFATWRRDWFAYDDDGYGNLKSTLTRWSDGREQSVSVDKFARTAVGGASLVNAWLVGLPEEVTFTGRAQTGDLELVPKGHKLHFRYDTRGRVKEANKLSLSEDWEFRAEFGYDETNGNLISRTLRARDAVTRTDTVSYDEHQIFPKAVSNTVYEAAEVPPTELGFDLRTGALRYQKLPDGSWSVRNHDAFGRLRITASDGGGSTTISYSGTTLGLLTVTVEGPSQPFVQTQYNAFGQPILTYSKHWGGDLGNPSKATVQEFGYDERGRLMAESVPHLSTEPARAVHLYAYDNLGRLTTEEHPWEDEDGAPLMATWTHSYGHRAFAEGSHDPVPWDTLVDGVSADQVAGPEGVRTLIVKDQRGNTVGVVDASGTLTRYEYGAFDALQTVQTLDNVSRYVRDGFGRITSVIDTETGHHGYTYDGLDLVRSYERNIASDIGQRSTYNYDFLGRMESATTPDGLYTWDYDGDQSDHSLIGHLAAESISSGTMGTSSTSYVYGGPGGAMTEVHRVIDGQSFDSFVEYDSLGRPEVIRYPVPGRLFALQYKYQSTHGRLMGVFDAAHPDDPLWELEDVDAFGNATEVRYGNGVITTREHERNTGRLSHTVAKSADGTTVHDERLRYDRRGLLAKRVRLGGWEESFTHDGLGRLRTRTRPSDLGGGTEVFAYYDNGNLAFKSDVGLLSYGDEDHPHRVTETFDGREFDYDDHGRQNFRGREGQPETDQRIEYTAFDLPLVVRTGAVEGEFDEEETNEDVAVTRYTYDASNRRLSREDPDGKRTLYVGDVYEQTTTEGAGVEHRIRIATPDGPVIEASLNGKSLDYLYHTNDHLGSPAAVTNGQGIRIARVSHGPFGAPELNESADARVRPQFTGHEHDATGLINMRGRMYDPAVGRFLTPDPFVPHPLSSQSWNRYSYVQNSPLNLVDPSGFLDAQLPNGAVDAEVSTETEDPCAGYENCTYVPFGDDFVQGSPGGSPTSAESGPEINDGLTAPSIPFGAPSGMEVPLALPGVLGEIEQAFAAPAVPFNEWFREQAGAASTKLDYLEARGVNPGPEAFDYGVTWLGQLLFSTLGNLSALDLLLAFETGGTGALAEGALSQSGRVVTNGSLIPRAGAARGAPNGFGPNSVGAAQRVWTKSARMNAAQLPHHGGKVRYVPPKNWHASEPLPRGPNNGYMDRFGNEWTKGPSRTAGEPFEWDVQLRDGGHWNVSLEGHITH
jgi:RHS repeat-associated protein